MVCNVFPGVESRRRFLTTLALLLGRIRPGLARKYAAANSMISHLLSLCDAGTGVSSSSRASVADVAGIVSLASFRSSGCSCLQQQTFAQWLHTPCVPEAGVINIHPDVKGFSSFSSCVQTFF